MAFEPKWTPGTWCVSNGKLLRIAAVLPDFHHHPLCIAGVHRIGANGGMSAGDPLANAHIMSASKDMYEALLSAEESIVAFMGTTGTPMESGAGDVLAQVRAALRKAEGRSDD